MTQVTDGDVNAAEVAAQLRRVLAAIDAGEVEATSDERAYLAGAVDVLAAVASFRTPDHPVSDPL